MVATTVVVAVVAVAAAVYVASNVTASFGIGDAATTFVDVAADNVVDGSTIVANVADDPTDVVPA